MYKYTPLERAEIVTVFIETWPARSPNLTAPDFFLWGFFKIKSHEIEEIQPQKLQDVMKNALKRVESCIEDREHHLADIIVQS
ncbi:hypothetical protein GWI33_009144 [Rhynchophorus ferrugineus]|uniref:Uncharacterized protein n=1 Tax=Rhynchophorus ferrugineus TaxID=354439 RepID=A0A834MFG6_RHYFE|nr:hypothetical protein GWI33_009144 [Rhynchophorus ferrugineus]